METEYPFQIHHSEKLAYIKFNFMLRDHYDILPAVEEAVFLSEFTNSKLSSKTELSEN